MCDTFLGVIQADSNSCVTVQIGFEFCVPIDLELLVLILGGRSGDVLRPAGLGSVVNRCNNGWCMGEGSRAVERR